LIASSIARRYAKALLDIAAEKGILERVGKEITAVKGVIAEHRELAQVLTNPMFPRERRLAIMKDLGKRMLIHQITNNFLKLLVDRDRIRFLSDIIKAYLDLADQRAGRIRAEVVTASHLKENHLFKIRSALEKQTGKKVVLEQSTDPALLGGIITRIGGLVYDGSVRSQLKRLRSELME